MKNAFFSKPTYLSLFSGAGVGCFGFKKQGFECVATVELVKKRLEVQKINMTCSFPSGYILGDIAKNETKKKIFSEVDYWSNKNSKNGIDVIIATPPCQGMSVANHKKNDETSRNSLVLESLEIIEKILPKFFVIENVKTFFSTYCLNSAGKKMKIKEAIENQLGGQFNVLYKVVNLKNYGANSSRVRSLVLGVRKDLKNVTPYDIFPDEKKPIFLKELFSGLKKLDHMGEVSSSDIWHYFRPFDRRMLPWIENLNQGASAFENLEPERIPHQIKLGKRIENKNKNGDKYRRWFWEKEGPCIHTRTDILASQNTIHPEENRVFSIRELMLMMSIPSEFNWVSESFSELAALCEFEKQKILKDKELVIRQSIGESVPTAVFESIASKIKFVLSGNFLSKKEILKAVNSMLEKKQEINSVNVSNLVEEFGVNSAIAIAENANLAKITDCAFFSRSDIIYTILKDLPDFEKKDSIKILEPAVGAGSFVVQLLLKYKNIKNVEIDVVDINHKVLDFAKKILSLIKIAPSVKINFYCSDFLTMKIRKRYDLVIGNPPFMKIPSGARLKVLKSNFENRRTNNLYSFFIEKAIAISDNVAFIVPKSLLNAPEFDITRKIMLNNSILKICDYGEKAFADIKIETISFILGKTCKKGNELVKVESYIHNKVLNIRADYIFSADYPYWLIYRNEKFDMISEKLLLNVFDSFRDRQITKKLMQTSGSYKVLRSKNVGDNEIVSTKSDLFLNDLSVFSVRKFLNKPAIVMVPNLTYKPRAAFLPKDSLVDGSVALLKLKNSSAKITKNDISYFSSNEFQDFYKIARNFGTRTLNIDKNSTFFFGLKKEK